MNFFLSIFKALHIVCSFFPCSFTFLGYVIHTVMIMDSITTNKDTFNATAHIFIYLGTTGHTPTAHFKAMVSGWDEAH